MLDDNKIQEMRNRYEALAIEHHEGTATGNYRKTNKAYDRLQKLYHEIIKEPELIEAVILYSLGSQDIRVNTWAASHCLGLGINIKEAENVLSEAVQSSEHPLLRFTAKMTLQVWRENGRLSF